MAGGIPAFLCHRRRDIVRGYQAGERFRARRRLPREIQPTLSGRLPFLSWLPVDQMGNMPRARVFLSLLVLLSSRQLTVSKPESASRRTKMNGCMYLQNYVFASPSKLQDVSSFTPSRYFRSYLQLFFALARLQGKYYFHTDAWDQISSEVSPTYHAAPVLTSRVSVYLHGDFRVVGAFICLCPTPASKHEYRGGCILVHRRPGGSVGNLVHVRR